MGVVDVVIGDLNAAESGEISAGAEGFADVFGESADVSAGAAVDADFELWVGIVEDVDRVDFDFASRGIEIFALPSEFIGTLAVDFDGAETRWSLLYFPHERLTKFANLGSSAM